MSIELRWRDGDPAAPWTPWGPAQFAREIVPGVFNFETAGHGGLRVDAGAAEQLSAAAAAIGRYDKGGYLWYEEDCAAAVLLFDVPAWAEAARELWPLLTREELRGSLRRWYPEYLAIKEPNPDSTEKNP